MSRNKTQGTSIGHHVVCNAVKAGVLNGLAVWVEQCVPGVDGFGVSDGKDRFARCARGVTVAEVF